MVRVYQGQAHHGEGAGRHCDCRGNLGTGVEREVAYCDNTAAVAIVNSGSAKNGQAMQLRQCLAYLMAMNQFSVRATHIQGALNVAADALSRNDLSRFRMCCPQAQQQGSPIPAGLLDTLLLRELDWTRKDWVESWTSTLDRLSRLYAEKLLVSKETIFELLHTA